MFIVVRHGNTFEAGTKPRRIGARTDLPLTQAGIDQARSLGTHFASQGITFDRVLTSPLTRTRQTAQHVLAQQVAPPQPETADFLREIDHGPDEDKPEEEVLARIGSDALAAWEARADAPDGWIVEPQMRTSAWSELLASKVGKSGATLLVTSNGAARFALLADPNLRRQAEALDTLKLPSGGYGIIERQAVDDLKLVVWGRRP